jgi:hypothetical protein
MSKLSLIQEAAEKALGAEAERTVQLTRRAEKSAAAIVIVLGFQLLDTKIMLESSSQIERILCYLSLAALVGALFCAFRGMGMRGYGGYPRGNKLWDNLQPENVSEAAAQEALVQMLLTTREQNARLNDGKGKMLEWCGRLLFAGILLVAGSQLLDAFTMAFA